MAERGIWVRLFVQAARGIRLGLPPDEAGWLRLEKALHEWNTQ
jgi:cobalamin biosynthetic protein CobC